MSMDAYLRRRLSDLEDLVVELLRHHQDSQRRIANLMRPGRVTEIDPEKGLVKVEWGKDDKGQPVTTGWIPWSTRAGKIKDWNPPSVGEQVLICSPCGEMGPNSWVQVGGYSNENPRNHNKDGERLIQIGGSVFHLTKDTLTIKVKNMKVEAGKVEYIKKPPPDPGETPAPAPSPVSKPSVPTADVPMS